MHDRYFIDIERSEQKTVHIARNKTKNRVHSTLSQRDSWT